VCNGYPNVYSSCSMKRKSSLSSDFAAPAIDFPAIRNGRSIDFFSHKLLQANTEGAKNLNKLPLR
jgi:hypothetical protein